ncbi:MAG: hypothetical protein QMB62_02300 [Oscillospiraceae bacterium]
MATNTIESKVFSIDDARDTLDRIILFINNCDNKASIMLGILGAILTVFLTGSGIDTLNNILNLITNNLTFGGLILLIIMIVSVIIFFFGLYKLISVIVAKIRISENDSKIYFRDIAENESLELYRLKLLDMDENGILNNLIAEIYINSKICSSKFKKYNCGLRLSIIGLVTFVSFFLIGTICF